jgi:hypothetical protein
MNTYWKIKKCLSVREEKLGTIATRLYPKMEWFPLNKWGVGYWSNRVKREGMPKSKLFSN